MSSSRQEPENAKSKSSGSLLPTLGAIGLGAVTAIGAYFVGKAVAEEEAEAKYNAYQHYEKDRREQYRNQQEAMRHAAEAAAAKKDTDDTEEQLECPICMTEFETLKKTEGDIEIHTTPCGHVFCSDCIRRCLAQRPQCPTCKRRVNPGQTLRIFI